MSKSPEPPDRLKDLSPEQRAILMRTLRDRTAGRAMAASIPKRPPAGPAPLSFAQQRLWFLDRLSPGTSTYNIARALRLRGRLDVSAFERALHEIARRHAILRTRFEGTPAGPVQIVAPSLAPVVPVIDLGALPVSSRETEISRLASEEARRPFDLTRGPLLRTVLLRLAADDHIFVLAMHHIVGDGWSLGALDRELAILYEAFCRGRPSPLPDLPIQYSDFAHWQRERLRGEELRGLLDSWLRCLEGAPRVLDLPLDRPRPQAPSYGGARVSFMLPAEQVARVRALALREKATSFMALLAAFQALLHRWSGQDVLCVGTPVAGRTRLEIEPLIGCFVNTLVLRGDLSGDPTLLELLRRVRAETSEALANQELPFEKLVENLRPERDPSIHPLFQTMFVVQEEASPAPDLPGLKPEIVDLETRTTPFDLTLVLSGEAGGMEGTLEYSTDLFDSPTVERMAGHFAALVEALAADPAQKVSAVSLPGLEARRERARSGGVPESVRAPGRGSVDRAAPRPFVPPRTESERALARIWAELLGGESFGIDDNFFEAGGHSLLVLQLVARVRERLRVDLPVRRVFERPTLGGLAENIDAEVRSGAPFEETPIRAAPRQGPAPLSFAQRRLWFIDQLQPGSPAYNIPLALRLTGRLDPDALERSLEAIVSRHEVLRTVFPLEDGEPVQAVGPAATVSLPRVDLGVLPRPERETEALRLAAEEARAPFDLARGPLFRGRLLRRSDEDHILLLTMHHIVADGWSIGVLLRELQTFYDAHVTGRPPLLPHMPIQYADYASWERSHAEGGRAEAQAAYWRKQLSGAPTALDLPTDRPRPAAATFHGSWR
ncbi:MAG: hypothetical protein DMF50_02030, partial [Acidobacteria bacterium]